MAPDYSAAVFPDRYRVAGVWLKPFSLGHALLLQRIESPFSFDVKKGPPGRADVVAAAFICHQSWRDSARLLDTRRAKSFLWLKSFLSKDRMMRDTVTMHEYIEASVPHVDFWRKGETKTSGIGMVHALISAQRRHYGMDLEGALDVPVAVAQLDRVAFADDSGWIEIFNERDDALIEAAKRRN